MLLSIKEMEVRTVRFDQTFEPGQIDFSGAEVVQVTPLHAQGEAELLENTDGEVRIQGRIQVTIESECDRCLGRARFPLDSQYDLFYRPLSALASVEAEVAIDPGEAEIGFYKGQGLELEEILSEQILLLLPMRRVCGEGCKGICPVCGANRNETDCACVVPSGTDRWAALQNL